MHGTPSSQFTRAPQATDGCVAVANPDLERILRTVEVRTTPVLIEKNLNWVRPDKLASQRQQFQRLCRLGPMPKETVVKANFCSSMPMTSAQKARI
ncbi:L,D-transpeptidase family protein [Rhodoferax fermentans]|uniref:L,D-TPase catalytic domain-containing protein n=1 Tax=Rhodoferax fermentans TaxID=28066 RepID=A0A1T1AXH4_RHOFE|nr:hypothetical protein RF819_20860 [Rhodoferax fermentans]